MIPVRPIAAVAQEYDYGNDPSLRFREIGCPQNLAGEQREPRFRVWGWPLELPAGRRQAVERQRRIERLVRCDMIVAFSLMRQRQILAAGEQIVLDAELGELADAVAV